MNDPWETICERAAVVAEQRAAALEVRAAWLGGVVLLVVVGLGLHLLTDPPRTLGWFSTLLLLFGLLSMAGAAGRWVLLSLDDAGTTPPPPADLAGSLRLSLGVDPGGWLEVDDPAARAQRRWWAMRVVEAAHLVTVRSDAVLLGLKLFGLGAALLLSALLLHHLGFYLLIPLGLLVVWRVRPRFEL